jgi:putative heme-binding domain-containing protein
VIRPVPDALLFDTRELTVVAGRPIELVFDNVDLMPHNLLVAAPGSLATVGMAAERMAADPDAWDRGYVPDVPEVIVATALLQPGESETLRFRAPEAPGDYPYVCTFPGHWVRMNGVLHVVADESLLEARRGPASEGRVEPAAVARPFVKHWKAADFELDGPALAAASPERGRAVLEAASCLACHSIALDDGGGLTGPLLSEAAARYDAPELLRHLLEPSARIAEEYATEIVVMTDGAVYAGVVVEETAEHLVLRDDPYRVLEPLLLPLDEIAERAPSTVSTMPTGLLSTFERADVVDLVAYLRSLAPGSDD